MDRRTPQTKRTRKMNHGRQPTIIDDDVERCAAFNPIKPHKALITKMENAASSYPSPSWASKPKQDDWRCVEIKGGMEVDTHVLRTACTVFGRAGDIVTLHESCSRRHARIAFDNFGIPWLRDLSSANGTFVNKKRLPEIASGKTESISTKKGSRGIQLYPGDVLQFGASTRLYCLEGPPEYERGAIEAKLAANKTKVKVTAASRAAEENAQDDSSTTENTGISWGMDMDDDPAAHDDDEHANDGNYSNMDLDPAKIPPKHVKAWERIAAKKYKLQNLQVESQRIQSKAITQDLTEGQSAQLNKNKTRETQLEEEIDFLEKELWEKMNPKAQNTTSRERTRRRQQENDEDDVDDFYDRTIDRNQDNNNKEGETEASLIAKFQRLVLELQQQNIKVTKCQDILKNIQQKLLDADEEDSFFVQNEVNLAQDEYEKALQVSKKLERQLDDTERLLRIVSNNKLSVFDRSTGHVGTNIVMPPPPTTSTPSSNDNMLPPAPVGTSMPPPPSANHGASPPRSTSMPPPPSFESMPPPPSATAAAVKTISNQSDNIRNDSNTGSMLPPPPPTIKSVSEPKHSTDVSKNDWMPPPKRLRTIGPTAAEPDKSDATTTQPLVKTTNKSHRHHDHHAMGTLAGLSFQRDDETRRPKHDDDGTQRQHTFKPKSGLATADPKRDEWRAPKGQDGSGITKLNAKFAGRY